MPADLADAVYFRIYDNCIALCVSIYMLHATTAKEIQRKSVGAIPRWCIRTIGDCRQETNQLQLRDGKIELLVWYIFDGLCGLGVVGKGLVSENDVVIVAVTLSVTVLEGCASGDRAVVWIRIHLRY